MVEGYLMHAKSLLGRIGSSLNIGDKNNYQIFVPESNRILGYFENEDMNFSKEKFYDFLSLDSSRDFFDKIDEGEFLKKVELNPRFLEHLVLFNHNLDFIREKVNGMYFDIEKSLKKS